MEPSLSNNVTVLWRDNDLQDNRSQMDLSALMKYENVWRNDFTQLLFSHFI